MPIGGVRRAQLIAPFGVGAMLTFESGISLICCGLDHWYERETAGEDKHKDIDIEEYMVSEWRLARELGADHFRLPPDYRERRKYQEPFPNSSITVPFLRFPLYHYCTHCGYLEKYNFELRGHPVCPECSGKGKKRRMVQVPFVAVCECGHLEDFPFREWVHSSVNPTCTGKMTLRSSGGASLASQIVKCECGAQRSLAGITSASGGTTYLSTKLDRSQEYLCSGKRPWLRDDEGEGCGRHLRGSLRNASNLYFPVVKSSIYLPKIGDLVSGELMEIMDDGSIKAIIKYMYKASGKISVEDLRDTPSMKLKLKKFSDQQIEAAAKKVLGIDESDDSSGERAPYDDDETAFRREEYDTLQNGWKDSVLQVTPMSLDDYDTEVSSFFSKVMLVEKLKETRVLTGFARVNAENSQKEEEKMRLMWREEPVPRWLPANVIYGEGIFFGFDESRLSRWEETMKDRVSALIERYEQLATLRHYRRRPLSPRFLLLHTFAHLMINRLVFECGYSSASLRERLYISNSEDGPMAGVLIYTAAGDSEGTMGGLVDMGRPGRLESVVRRAVEGAMWCSADPVCMEMGDNGGQGPDSCNLAACHNCALLPETACEEFNRFLDRAMVVGTIKDRSLGYFSEMISD